MTQSTIELAESSCRRSRFRGAARRSPPTSTRRGSRPCSPRSTSTGRRLRRPRARRRTSIYLSNFDPRFEEAILVLGRSPHDALGRRTSSTRRSSRSTSTSIARPDVQPDGDRPHRDRRSRRRCARPASARATASASSAGRRSSRASRSARSRRSSRPRSSSTLCASSRGRRRSSPTRPRVLTYAARRPAHVQLRRPDRAVRVGRVALLGLGDGHPRRGAARCSENEACSTACRGTATRSATTRCSRRARTSRSVSAARRRGGSRSATRRSRRSACGAGTARAAGFSRPPTPTSARRATASSRSSRCRTGARWRRGTRRSQLGKPGGDVFAEVTGLLEREAFASSLNPGHLVHYDEWLDSPIRAGSSDPIASGMIFQSDIIPTGIRVGLDDELRGHGRGRRRGAAS